ncbi:magnesium transporter protein 1, partial [Trichinella spiralis]
MFPWRNMLFTLKFLNL